MSLKFHLKTKLVLSCVIVFSISLILAIVSAKSTNFETKEGRILINEPTKNGSFFISAEASQNIIQSPIIRTDFPFNALFVNWSDSAGSELSIANHLAYKIYVKFLNEKWSDWQLVEFDDDFNGKTEAANYSSQLLNTKLTDSLQYKIVFESTADRDQLKNLEFVYLDTTKGPKKSFSIASASNDSLKIISRQEWGADEKLRYDNSGNDLWPAEYYTPEKFVIHHTAGEKANNDSYAAVRAIYYWHAVSKGWGDIGYNYLIDNQGNIFEGRAGGDGIVGGHAYMNNRNTIGIALLGCYQNDGTCNTATQLTAAAENALNNLIAVKAREFNIDPLGNSIFQGHDIANILGHKDLGSTLCPGNILYAQLPQARTLAYNVLQDLGGYKKPLATSAQFVRVSSDNINIEETKTQDIYVEYKNTGQAVWRGYEDAGLYIADSSVKNKLAVIGSVNIASANKNKDTILTQYQLLGGNVYPGEIGKFKITFSAPTTKTTTQNFTLAWQGKGYFSDSDFSITVNRIACTSCQTGGPSTEILSANITSINWPEKMTSQITETASLEIQNTGNQIWKQNNLALKIVTDKNETSQFKSESWPDEQGLFLAQQNEIAPMGTATFKFDLQAPKQAGDFNQTISLLYNNKEIFTVQKTTIVIAPYAAQITANTIPVAMKTSWRPKVKITFKNTGTKTWDKLILKSYDIDYTNSWFKDWSWQDAKTIKTLKKTVAPGQEITFEFRLKPYWKPNTYPQIFKLYNNGQEIGLNSKSEMLIYTRVDK